MGFYNTSKFIITHHALIRAKERLDWGIDSDLIIEAKLKVMLSQSYVEFDSKGYLYYPIPNSDKYYFVVKENENQDKFLVTTVTEMSMAKKMKLIQ